MHGLLKLHIFLNFSLLYIKHILVIVSVILIKKCFDLVTKSEVIFLPYCHGNM